LAAGAAEFFDNDVQPVLSVCKTTRRSPFFPSGIPVTAKVCRDAADFVEFFFDLDVRNHFAPDFAEAAEPVGDLQEAIFIEARDVAGDIPAVAH